MHQVCLKISARDSLPPGTPPLSLPLSADGNPVEVSAQRVYARLQAACRSHNTEQDRRLLIQAADRLTQQVLTSEQTTALSELAPGTEIVVEAPLTGMTIPFELLRCQGQWLCERFAISRRVTDVGSRADDFSTHRTDAVCLAVHGRDLLWVPAEEATVLSAFGYLSAVHPHCRLRTDLGPCADAESALTLFRSARWLHFAGHAVRQDGVRGLRVSSDDRGLLLTPERLEQLPERLPEFLFLNACGSLEIPSDSTDTTRPTLLSVCLRKGVRWLMGSAVPFADHGSWDFVREFYTQLLAGVTMGEAKRRAHTAAERHATSSLAHLAYVLYGDSQAVCVRPDITRALDSTTQTSGHRTPHHNAFAVCDICHAPIETPHGVSPDVPHRTVCRTCVRAARHIPVAADDQGKSGVTAESGRSPLRPAAIALSTQPERAAPTGTAVATPLRPRGSDWHDFLKRFAEACERFPHLHDPADGRTYHVRVERVKGNDQDHTDFCVFLTDRTVARSVLLRLQRCQPDPPGAVSSMAIHPAADNRFTDIKDTHQRLFVWVSLEGLSDDQLHDFLRQPAGEQDPGTSIAVYDGARNQVSCRHDDLEFRPWQKLFDLETDRQQTQRVVRWLEEQLPFPASVSVMEAIRELGVRVAPAEYAFRLVAQSASLRLHDLAEFGLVLEPPDR